MPEPRCHGGDGYDRGPQAAEERLPSTVRQSRSQSRRRNFGRSAGVCASLPDRNTRMADEILGYDEWAAELVVIDTSAIIAALLNEANAVGIAGRSTPLPRVAFFHVVSREADTTPARHKERKMSPGFSSEALSFGTALGDRAVARADLELCRHSSVSRAALEMEEPRHFATGLLEALGL